MATISNKVLLFESDIPPMELRADDAKEVAALNLSAGEAIAISWAKSNICFAVYFHDTLGAIWGLRRTGPIADVWLLTTEEVEAHPFAFFAESFRLMHCLLKTFEVLRCEVHTEYSRALNWLKHLGFAQVNEPNHLGFMTMERRR